LNKKLKIAVNTRFLIPNKLEGIGTYTHQIMKRLVKIMPEVEFHFLFDRQWSEEYIYSENIIPHKLSPPARHPFLWYYWFEKSVTNWLKKNPVDIFLSLDSFMSLKTYTTTFLVVHDLAFEHFPEHVPFLVRKYYQTFFPKFTKKAEKIFAVSKFTKQDIISRYNIKENKISIAYCGVSEVYKPISEEEKIVVQNKVTNGNPYFICIGSLNPRKNIQRVVQAFNSFKKTQEKVNYKLLIVGAKGWKTNNIYNEIENSKYQKDIVLLGHIEPEKLSKYLASSLALIFPSLFEGFGLPIVEAYKCKVPVITSNVSSTKEIGENSAILVDPQNFNDIKNAMITIIENKFWNNNIVKDREKKLLKFDWHKTANIISSEIRLYVSRIK